MKVTFYYVRHGETVLNRERRIQGQCDSPLTERGRKQAEKTALALKNIPFTRAYISDLGRVVETAGILLQPHPGLSAVSLPELREYGFGELEGKSIDEYQELIRKFQAKNDWTEVHGENKEVFEARLKRGMKRILSECSDNDLVLIVSHGSFFSRMLEPLFQMDREAYIKARRENGKMPIGNCEYAVFSYEDGTYSFLREPEQAS